ncbi:MAG: cytochrome c biogenesis protein CcsA [Myxococcota bacterium]
METDLVPLLRNALAGIIGVVLLAWFVSDEDRAIRSTHVTGPLSLILGVLWLGMVVFYAPTEKVQGIVQKIFYVHVPCVPAAYLGFLFTAVGGIGYLRTHKLSWDRVAQSSAEVGVLFCTLILLSGPIWAKPIWGHWWVWDLRLTSILVLWFIYVAYLFLRGLAFGSDTARTFAAIYGIVGTAGIPFVYYAIDIVQGSTLHPENPARAGLPLEMAWTLIVGILAFLVFYFYLTAQRLEIARVEEQVRRTLMAEQA